MAVVIHEFEVVTETKPETRQGAGLAPGPQTPSVSSTPNDINRILRHLLERSERIRAH